MQVKASYSHMYNIDYHIQAYFSVVNPPDYIVSSTI